MHFHSFDWLSGHWISAIKPCPRNFKKMLVNLLPVFNCKLKLTRTNNGRFKLLLNTLAVDTYHMI